MDDFKPFCLADNMARCPKAADFSISPAFAMAKRRGAPTGTTHEKPGRADTVGFLTSGMGDISAGPGAGKCDEPTSIA